MNEGKPSYVVALILDGNNQVVAVSRRNKFDDMALPGGSIEAFDDSPFAAMQREVLEETGIVVHEGEHVFTRVDETDGNIAWAYLVTKWEGKPSQQEEGVTAGWIKLERLLDERCTFHAYNRALLEKIGIIK